LSRLAIAAAVLAVPFAVWLAIQVARNPQTSLPSISMVIDRITSPSLWVARAWGFVNLLSGVSPLVHIAGPLPGWTALAANIAIAAIALAALVVGWPRLRVHRHAGWLLAGIGFAFAAFHVVAMDEALSPTSERYGVFMLVPMLVAIATAIDALTGRNSLAGRAAALVTAALMAAMLIGGYFVPLWTTGGNAMIAYRTGDTEPKAAAFSFIETDSRGADSIRVVADGWWLYWTLRYLAGADGRIHVDVVPGSNMPGGTHPAGAVVRPFPAPQRTYLVAFEGGAAPSAAASSSASFTARDPAGRPILHVFAVEQPR
jgi:hypothetical protein